MAEVEEQRAQFKPYDFSEIVKAINADQALDETGKASLATEKLLSAFKEDFQPLNIKKGRSWIKEHLQEGHKVFDQNWLPWNQNQMYWFRVNIIGSMFYRIEKCCEQECSQGLYEIVDMKKTNRRRNIITNVVNRVSFPFRGSHEANLLLGRDYYINIYLGRACDHKMMLRDIGESAFIQQSQINRQAWNTLKQELHATIKKLVRYRRKSLNF